MFFFLVFCIIVAFLCLGSLSSKPATGGTQDGE